MRNACARSHKKTTLVTFFGLGLAVLACESGSVAGGSVLDAGVSQSDAGLTDGSVPVGTGQVPSMDGSVTAPSGGTNSVGGGAGGSGGSIAAPTGGVSGGGSPSSAGAGGMAGGAAGQGGDGGTGTAGTAGAAGAGGSAEIPSCNVNQCEAPDLMKCSALGQCVWKSECPGLEESDNYPFSYCDDHDGTDCGDIAVICIDGMALGCQPRAWFDVCNSNENEYVCEHYGQDPGADPNRCRSMGEPVLYYGPTGEKWWDIYCCE